LPSSPQEREIYHERKSALPFMRMEGMAMVIFLPV
jgi:hypothetical protein